VCWQGVQQLEFKDEATFGDRDRTSLQLMCLFLSGTKHKVTHVSLPRFTGKLAVRQYATWQVELHLRTSSPSDSSASHIMTKLNLNFISSFSSYPAVNSSPPGYKNQRVSAV